MSRWSKRSQEEKERIYNEQVEQLESQKPYENRDDEIEDFKRIYSNGEIPIMCRNCLKWSGSDNYTIKKGSNPLTKSIIVITGTCRKCGLQTIMAFPSMLTSEGMMLSMVLGGLKSQDRVKDLR